ncbi:MAG: hypothetical protein J6S87_02995 [Bacteroidales bacterium]|nr:hypothetical protein [Bacteroidales bacterium]
MKKTRMRQLVAWVLLLAFCGMTGTKALHHHHWKAAEDIVCPLDGVTMSHHTRAHTVLQNLDDDDSNYCVICHFTVTKIVFPTSPYFFNSDQKLFPHLFLFAPCIQSNLQGVSLLRAPPFN